MLMSATMKEWREIDNDDSRIDRWVVAAVTRNEKDNYGYGVLLISAPLIRLFLINTT